MDINQPVTNPQLIAAMDAFLADGTQDNEQAMLDAVQQAYFLAPAIIEPSLPKPDSQGVAVTTTDTHIQFEMVANQRNQHFFPAFTDWEQLRLWKNDPEQKTVVLQLHDYASMLHTQGAGIVINPFGQNLVFSREHIFRLLDMVAPYVMEKGTKIILGVPAAWPDKLVETLTAHMRTVPAIRAAWLQLMVKGDEESFLIIVDADGNPAEHFDAIGKAAKPALGPKEIIDMVSAAQEFVQPITPNTQPFYRRDA